MDFAQIELVQIPNGSGGFQIVLAVKGTPIIGVESVNLGGDETGSFMDVRFRTFHLGSSSGDPEEVPEDKPDEEPEAETEP